MTLAELSAVAEARIASEEGRNIEDWRRMRTLACLIIQPFIDKKLDPREVLPLAGDDKPGGDTAPRSEETGGESHTRFVALMKHR